jgi:hypothetical protein
MTRDPRQPSPEEERHTVSWKDPSPESRPRVAWRRMAVLAGWVMLAVGVVLLWRAWR